MASNTVPPQNSQDNGVKVLPAIPEEQSDSRPLASERPNESSERSKRLSSYYDTPRVDKSLDDQPSDTSEINDQSRRSETPPLSETADLSHFERDPRSGLIMVRAIHVNPDYKFTRPESAAEAWAALRQAEIPPRPHSPVPKWFGSKRPPDHPTNPKVVFPPEDEVPTSTSELYADYSRSPATIFVPESKTDYPQGEEIPMVELSPKKDKDEQEKEGPGPVEQMFQEGTKGSPETAQKNGVDRQRIGLNPTAMTERVFKVIVVGDSAVGKTSFVHRYVQNKFLVDYKATIGVDFALKILTHNKGVNVKLQLWDIAGQDRFTWVTRVYFKQSNGCLLLFDITNKESFENTVKWKLDVDSKCLLVDGSPIPCMLLATKCDLDDKRQVDQMDIETVAKQHNFIGWTETSAKEGHMVNESVKFLVEVMMKQEGDVTNSDDDGNIVTLGASSSARKSCYC